MLSCCRRRRRGGILQGYVSLLDCTSTNHFLDCHTDTAQVLESSPAQQSSRNHFPARKRIRRRQRPRIAKLQRHTRFLLVTDQLRSLVATSTRFPSSQLRQYTTLSRRPHKPDSQLYSTRNQRYVLCSRHDSRTRRNVASASQSRSLQSPHEPDQRPIFPPTSTRSTSSSGSSTCQTCAITNPERYTFPTNFLSRSAPRPQRPRPRPRRRRRRRRRPPNRTTPPPLPQQPHANPTPKPPLRPRSRARPPSRPRHDTKRLLKPLHATAPRALELTTIHPRALFLATNSQHV